MNLSNGVNFKFHYSYEKQYITTAFQYNNKIEGKHDAN